MCVVTSVVSGSEILWTAVHQAPLSMGFSRQEYWSGLPCPPPESLSTRDQTHISYWQAGSLPLAPPGMPQVFKCISSLIIRDVWLYWQSCVMICTEHCQPGRLSWAWVFRDFTEVSLQSHDRLKHCPCGWILDFSFLEVGLISCDPKSHTSNLMLCLSCMTSLHPELSH